MRFVRNRLPKLAPSEVRAGLTRLRIRLDFPPVPAVVANGAVVSEEKPAARPAPVSGAPMSEFGQGTPWRGVTVGDLVAGGLLRLPAELHRTYKGHHLVGQLTTEGRASWQGQEFDSLSTGAGAARASVIGSPPGRRFPQTNGWTFWRFTDADGRPKPLDVLRQRYFESRLAPGG